MRAFRRPPTRALGGAPSPPRRGARPEGLGPRLPGARATARTLLALLALLAGWGVAPTATAGQGADPHPEHPAWPAGPVPGRYLVLFEDTVTDPHAASRALAGTYDLAVRHVYGAALSGFSASMEASAARALASEPGVRLVEQDVFATTVAQTLPTGVDRLQIDRHPIAAIDGVDVRVDVDVAILDTGVDVDHPDLDVFVAVDCTSGTGCPAGGDDGNGHGTHVAGIAAAIDDDGGVVGVAPGARIWAVKVLADDGTGYFSDVIAGIDYVTAHADEVEVANLSLAGQGRLDSLRDALAGSVEAGVFVAVAAGNASVDVYGDDAVFETEDDTIPAAYPEVATISAMSDTDGRAGGQGLLSSWQGADRNGDGVDDGEDDSFAFFSNFSTHVVDGNPVSSRGLAIDMLMPGVDITSTWNDGGTRTLSGTSMAAPHAAGLAALHIAEAGRALDAAEVAAIRSELIDEGGGQEDASGLAVLNDPDLHLEVVPEASAGGQALAALLLLGVLARLQRPTRRRRLRA